MDRRDIEGLIIERANTDPDFRAMLLANPHTALEQFVSGGVPSEINIRVEEEQPGEVVLVLPLAPGTDSGLADADIVDMSSGGWLGGGTSPGCSPRCGDTCTACS